MFIDKDRRQIFFDMDLIMINVFFLFKGRQNILVWDVKRLPNIKIDTDALSILFENCRHDRGRQRRAVVLYA